MHKEYETLHTFHNYYGNEYLTFTSITRSCGFFFCLYLFNSVRTDFLSSSSRSSVRPFFPHGFDKIRAHTHTRTYTHKQPRQADTLVCNSGSLYAAVSSTVSFDPNTPYTMAMRCSGTTATDSWLYTYKANETQQQQQNAALNIVIRFVCVCELMLKHQSIPTLGWLQQQY